MTKYTGVVGSVSLPSTTSKVNQVVNSTGGYVFQLAPRDHFIRFLMTVDRLHAGDRSAGIKRQISILPT